MMTRALEAALLAAAVIAAAGQTLELEGRIEPAPGRAFISLDGATMPFTTAGVADARGRFRFRELAPGTYTLTVAVPGLGEVRRTVEVGPSLADPRGRVRVTIPFQPSESALGESTERRHKVSVQELQIPERAVKEYLEAQRSLGQRDAEAAIRHLRRAVELAPQFAVAWNNLGTIVYRTRKYEDAEKYFREALKQEPGAYSPLLNLGGVLLNLRRYQEALPYNLKAVSDGPGDALARSQLGANYFLLGDQEKALEHLTAAKRLDPSHFSRPQLFLAEIYLRRSDRARAIQELEDLLARHPDAPDAATIRRQIEGLKKR